MLSANDVNEVQARLQGVYGSSNFCVLSASVIPSLCVGVNILIHDQQQRCCFNTEIDPEEAWAEGELAREETDDDLDRPSKR